MANDHPSSNNDYYYQYGDNDTNKDKNNNSQTNHSNPTNAVTPAVIYDTDDSYHRRHHNHHGSKQGHLCCGGCCDVRRAVIIVDSINLFILSMALISIIILQRLGQYAVQQFSDATSQENGYYYPNEDDFFTAETFVDEVTTFTKSFIPINLIIGIVCIRIVSSICGIIGAICFNPWCVGITAIMYCLDVLFGILLLNPFDIVVYGLFAYPHIVFLREMNLGIMTPETYSANEDFCCCCV